MIGHRNATTILITLLAASGCRSEQNSARDVAPGVDARLALSSGGPGNGAGPGHAAAGARRLWVGEYTDFYASAVSPDGRYVTQVDWTTGDLAVRDLATGNLHRLTDKGPWEESGDYAQSARFSPDGHRVAYAWYDAGTSDYEIHVLDFIEGDDAAPRASGARVVYAGGVPQPASRMFDWLSDDEVLIGLYRADNSTALARLSLSTGSLDVLESFDWDQEPGRVEVSPDRRFIAYDQPSSSDSATAIQLLSADGRRETRLVEVPGEAAPLGWEADGSLLFHRGQSGDGAIWRLPLSDGRATASAVLVRENVPHLQSLGLAGDVLYYGLVVESPAYVTATIDFDGHQLRSLPTRFDAPGIGLIVGLAWSPDGKHVIYRVQDPTSAATRVQLRSADARLIREWKLELWPMRTVFGWVSDGNAVLVPARDRLERPGFIRIDLETGEETMARRFDSGGEMGKVFATSPDGATLYYTRHQLRDGVMDESFADIIAHDLASGDERPIRRVHGHGTLTVSPGGKWLALATGTRTGEAIHTTLQVVVTDGSQARTVYRGAGANSLLPFDSDAPPVGSVLFCQCHVVGWSPDSRSILFLDLVDRTSDDPVDVDLLRVWIDGGAVERVATIPDYDAGATVQPDGRTIAYRTGRWRGEIWALELSADPGRTADPVPEGRT